LGPGEILHAVCAPSAGELILARSDKPGAYPRAAREAQRSSQNALDISNRFTEGFDITDLKEAKALLEELTGG